MSPAEEEFSRSIPTSENNSNRDEIMWGMFCHLASFAVFIIPFGNIIGPLIVWLLKRDEFPLVEDQGKEALNFQISILIYAFISALLIFAIVGIVLFLLVALFDIVMIVVAIVRVSSGERYRYPLSLRLIR